MAPFNSDWSPSDACKLKTKHTTPSATPFEGNGSIFEAQLITVPEAPVAGIGNGGASGTGLKHACPVQGCNKTFTRPADLARHERTIHADSSWYWCPIQSCNRSFFFDGDAKHFNRKDKRGEHVKKVHKDEVVDLEASDAWVAEYVANVVPTQQSGGTVAGGPAAL